MGLRSFFKKPTNEDLLLGRIEAGYYMGLGQEVVRERGTKWYKFFSWMGPVGSIIFYVEGRREQKRKEESGGELPKILRKRHDRSDREKKRKYKSKQKDKKKKWKAENRELVDDAIVRNGEESSMSKTTSVEGKTKDVEKGRRWLLWVSGLCAAVVILGGMSIILFLGD